MTTFRFSRLLCCLFVLAGAENLLADDDPQDLSDYRFQAGSVSINNTTLRNRATIGGLASPATEISFQIQQNGFAPGPGGTQVPYFVVLTHNVTGVSYTTRHSEIASTVQGATNSTAAVVRRLDSVNGMPFGTYTVSVILDRDQEVCDLDRSNNSVVVSSAVDFVPTPDFELYFLEVDDGLPFEDTTFFAAGDEIPVKFTLNNEGDALSNPVAVRVNLYLTSLRRSTPQSVGHSRDEILLHPDTVFWGSTFAFPDTEHEFSLPLPAGLNALEYSIAAIVNQDLAIPEHEFDSFPNLAFQLDQRITVQSVYERPDLKSGTDVTLSPAQLSVGDSIQISSSYSNDTEYASTGTTLIHHYLQNTLLSTQRYLLGTSSALPLPAAPSGSVASRTYTVDFTLPSTMAAGTYQYFRVIDEIGVIPERDDQNNSLLNGPSVEVALSPFPDLAPASSNPFTASSESSGEVGKPLTLTAEVENLAEVLFGEIPAASAPPFEVDFFIQPISGSSPSTRRVQLGTVFVSGSTAVGGVRSVQLQTTIPDVEPGDYRFGYFINPDATVTERPGGNNESLNPMGALDFDLLPAVPSLPDLVLDSLLASLTETEFGKTVQVDIQVANIGSGNAAASQLRLTLSADAVAGNNDGVAVVLVNVPAIPAGGREVVSVPVTPQVPPEDPSSGVGTYHWDVEVGQGGILESDQTNNRAVVASPLLKLNYPEEDLHPNFEVTVRGATPLVIPPGSSSTAFLTLANEGFLTASQVEVGLYLSLSANFTPAADVLLHSFSPFDLAGLDESQDLEHLVEIPSDTAPGSYYLLWVIDAENRIPRINTNDFIVASRSIEVRPLQLRLEVLARTATHDILGLFDTEVGKTYNVSNGTRPDNLSASPSGLRSGVADNAIIYEFGNTPGAYSENVETRFFQAFEVVE